MDGRGPFLDNIFVESLWRSLKYEEIYLNAYVAVTGARRSIGPYFHFYNNERPHETLGCKTPKEIFSKDAKSDELVENSKKFVMLSSFC